jgi:hypothetical protein
MNGTDRGLAYIGGELLGALLGVFAGGCLGYFAFHETAPTGSQKTHGGDYLGAVADTGDRAVVGARNAGRAVAGAVSSGVVGTVLGVGFAALALRCPRNRSAGGANEPGGERPA